MSYDSLFNPTEDHAALRQLIADFTTAHVEPQAAKHDALGVLNVELFRQRCDLGQRCVIHGVRGMRGEGSVDERMFAVAVVDGLSFAQIVPCVRGPGGGESDDDHADHGTNAQRCGCGSGLVGEHIHIIEAGRASAEHFIGREPRAIADKFGRQPTAFSWPYVFL